MGQYPVRRLIFLRLVTACDVFGGGCAISLKQHDASTLVRTRKTDKGVKEDRNFTEGPSPLDSPGRYLLGGGGGVDSALNGEVL